MHARRSAVMHCIGLCIWVGGGGVMLKIQLSSEKGKSKLVLPDRK